MTAQKAHEILHPDTSREKIAVIEYYAGFDSEKAIEVVNEACIVACKALEKQVPKKPNGISCPSCSYVLVQNYDLYCPRCGQKIDWT